MIKPVLSIIFCALIAAGCSSGDDNNSGGTTGGTTGGGTTGGGTTGGGGGTTGGGSVGGQSGDFGDSADASNGIDGTFSVCPASITGSFSSFAQNGSSWCIPKCPGNRTIENADGDEYGTYIDGTDRLTCRITTAAAGASIDAKLFAPIDGCPAGGCANGTFPRVYVSATAGTEMAGNYTCTAWVFNQNTQIWEEQSSPAAFSLTLNADQSAVARGSNTTWTFANGVLTLEDNLTLGNVAVGSGSLTSYESNTALTRCRT